MGMVDLSMSMVDFEMGIDRYEWVLMVLQWVWTNSIGFDRYRWVCRWFDRWSPILIDSSNYLPILINFLLKMSHTHTKSLHTHRDSLIQAKLNTGKKSILGRWEDFFCKKQKKPIILDSWVIIYSDHCIKVPCLSSGDPNHPS